MHSTITTSIILLFLGITFLILGIWLYWTTNPISNWASPSVVIGILLLLGAIIALCLGQNAEIPISR